VAEKIDRKQLKRPDEFQVVAGRAMAYLVAHKGPVLGVLGAIVVVAIAAWGLSAWRSSREMKAGAELAEAFRFLFDLRLRHQAAQVKEGLAPDDFIDPTGLGTIERSGLREAFRTIRGEQELLRLELGVR